MLTKVLGVIVFFVVNTVALAAQGAFSEDVLNGVQELQSKLFKEERNVPNVKEVVPLWNLLDNNVAEALNAEDATLTREALNDAFKLKKIYITLKRRAAQETIKTGVIGVEFVPLGDETKGKVDWVAVYYHEYSLSPSSTFHVFHYTGEQKGYLLEEKLEDTDFIKERPELQWKFLQIQILPKKGRFATFFVPERQAGIVNRSEVVWKWTGTKLKPYMWIAEVDFHTDATGNKIAGPGKIEYIR
jgi:hypothetical protein